MATVRLATCIPDATSVLAILLSLKGFPGSSFAINLRIMARIAVAEHSPPSEVDTWLEKKYLNSKIPRGVWMYFCVVTRDIVDS